MILSNKLFNLYEAYQVSEDYAHLRTDGIKFVPGRGSEKPLVMLLGEAPGATENLHRKPFVGRSGRLLDQLMNLAGLRADEVLEKLSLSDEQEDSFKTPNVFITNTVKYRPPGNRTPTREEIQKSVRWVRAEWRALSRPPVILTVGAVPLMCIAPEAKPLSERVAVPFKPRPHTNGPWIWPMYHPAYALRNPAIRPAVERHWNLLGEWIKENGMV